jgi:hypothetical protein
MEIEELDLEQLEKASPIVQVAIELGIKVQAGMGKCFRTDRHVSDDEKPTLFFNPAKNRFRCRECEDVGGNVVDLVCQYHGWDRKRAIDWLAHRAEFDRFTKKLYHGKGRKK